MKSNFTKDLAKEQKLSKLLDGLYDAHLKKYSQKRVSNITEQLQGIDVLFRHKYSNKVYRIDEKAQLDYPGRDLPTFAFELCYYKSNTMKPGWLFDAQKKTDFYALTTNITLKNDSYVSCSIRFVNRKKLDMNTGGYLYFSGKRKAERPVNLVLYLDMLEHLGIAKRFI